MFLPTVRKKNVLVIAKKQLKFGTEYREFAKKKKRSQEQFIRTGKGKYNL